MEARRTILVVDDAAMFRDLESLFLMRCGRVITAVDGAEALAAVWGERPDVVVADLTMPVVDGAALCKEIKASPDLSHTPVILVTSGHAADDRARAVQAGADDVLAKPINRIALIQAVNRFLRFAEVRGLIRVPLEAPVRIHLEREDTWGTAHNLSRGGMFVAADRTAPPETEVKLLFRLPEMNVSISPTARVIWSREQSATRAKGMGLQFLALDRSSSRYIEEFIFERAAAQSSPDPCTPSPPAR